MVRGIVEKVAITAFLALLGAGELAAAASGVNRWSPSGLGGISISRIVIDPRSPLTLFAAGGAAGLFRSTDGGVTWSRLTVDLSDPASVGVDTSAFR